MCSPLGSESVSFANIPKLYVATFANSTKHLFISGVKLNVTNVFRFAVKRHFVVFRADIDAVHITILTATQQVRVRRVEAQTIYETMLLE